MINGVEIHAILGIEGCFSPNVSVARLSLNATSPEDGNTTGLSYPTHSILGKTEVLCNHVTGEHQWLYHWYIDTIYSW